MRVKVDSFKDCLKAYSGDIDKFCDHVHKTMECLKSTGDSDGQDFDKIFEALVESHVQPFNESIRVWKTVCEQSGAHLNIQSLLNQARKEYQQLQVQKKWAKFSGTSRRVEDDVSTSTKRKHDPDIASLLAASEKRSNKWFKKQMTAMLASNHKPPTKPSVPTSLGRQTKILGTTNLVKERIFRTVILFKMATRIT